MDAFLRSCECNPHVTWLIFSDIKTSDYRPGNVQFIDLKKADLSALIFHKTNIRHTLEDPHKLCDFKPLYGHIFEDYLREYEYWGHCDMDVIWGDLFSFLNAITFQHFDLVSTRPNAISGHFTIYKNTQSLNLFYRKVPNYLKAFNKPHYQGFDEGYFSYHLFNEVANANLNIKPYWEARNCIDRAELLRMPNGWYWKNGVIKNNWGQQGNYLHLIDWKKTLEVIELSNVEALQSFKITHLGIWSKKIPWYYQKRMLLRTGASHKWKFFKVRIKEFIKYKVMNMKRKHQANVPLGYRIMK